MTERLSHSDSRLVEYQPRKTISISPLARRKTTSELPTQNRTKSHTI